MWRRSLTVACAALGAFVAPYPAHAEVPSPWRVRGAVHAPKWLRFGIEQRTRFEHLANDFRSTETGSSTALSLRTQLAAELRFGPYFAGGELQDARAYATDETPRSDTLVDAFDVLQAYAGVRGGGVSVQVGRFTIDLGSRRLVARNEFRNTVNAFTGIDLRWTTGAKHSIRAFAVSPVLRVPTDELGLERGRVVLDRENPNALFWGLFFGSAPLPSEIAVEAYVLGLHEGDGRDAPSANRRLVTTGVRVMRAPSPGKLDYQIEGMAQLGTSRATVAPTDESDLRHRAGSVHASIGYRLATPWKPRGVLQLDVASGDGDPNDRVNGRFDPLFGARRFDFGPTGIYGAIARSNVVTPGLRIEIDPRPDVDAFVSYRLLWLASSTDAWTTAGLRDPTGAAGSFVGQQLEGRVRWRILPGNLSLELGGALFVRGAFARDAPGARSDPAAYVYAQVTTTL